jgi:hypothetical protein
MERKPARARVRLLANQQTMVKPVRIYSKLKREIALLVAVAVVSSMEPHLSILCLAVAPHRLLDYPLGRSLLVSEP